MGRLVYGSSAMEVAFDDRTLAHLQIVVRRRFQARERFFLSWRDHADVGGGRSAVWLDPSVGLVFHYSDSFPVRINHEWIALLATPEPGSGALVLQPEPGSGSGATLFPHSQV